jgi:hypothetical protein
MDTKTAIKGMGLPMLIDAKGNLTRYPYSMFQGQGRPLDREWVKRFVEAGGHFDVNGVYGCEPYVTYPDWTKHCPVWCASVYLAHVPEGRGTHRWDELRRFLLATASKKGKCSKEYYRVLARGVKRQRIVHQLGIWPNAGGIEHLGRMPWKRFVRPLCVGWTPDTDDNAYRLGLAMPTGKGPAYCKALALLDKGCQAFLEWRKSQLEVYGTAKVHGSRYVTYYHNPYLHTNKVVQYEGEDAEQVLRIRTIQTERGALSFVALPDVGHNYWGEAWAFWCGNDCTKHVEVNVPNLRQAIDEFWAGEEARQAKAQEREHLRTSLSLSLYQIHNDTPFCFAGTLGWLEQEMPYVAYLIRQSGATSWDTIPADLLEEVWHISPQVRQRLSNRLH